MRRKTAVATGTLLAGAVLWLLVRGSDSQKSSTPRQRPAATSEAPKPPLPMSAVASVEAAIPAAAPRVPPSRSPYPSEDDYLRAIEQLNATDKPRALELVQQGEQWYPNSGVRTEAREAMGITLLVDLGEMEEARVRTRRFIAQHPESPYRPLVQGVTGIHPRPSVSSNRQ